MDDRVYVGNAAVDGATDAGWLLGHFKPPGDVRHSLADISRARAELGYNPEVDFLKGLRRCLADFARRHGGEAGACLPAHMLTSNVAGAGTRDSRH